MVPGAQKATIDWREVGRRIRRIRGLYTSQSRFALEIGVSQGQLSRYEQGRGEIGAEALWRLSRRSGRSIEWFLTGKEKV